MGYSEREEPGRRVVSRAASHNGSHGDPTASRRMRVTALRDLVAQRAYDIPAEDLAAKIIRSAIVVPIGIAQRH